MHPHEYAATSTRDLPGKLRKVEAGVELTSSDNWSAALPIKLFDFPRRLLKETTDRFTRKLVTPFASVPGRLNVRVW